MNFRRLHGAGALVLLAIALVAAVMVANRSLQGTRLDLTENRLYTLSEGSREVLRTLDEPVSLYFFYSEEAARELPWLRTYAQRVREFLEEIAQASDGQVRLSVLDPQPFSEDEDRATRFGLQAAPLGATGESLFFGLAGTNSVDDAGIIPFFQPDRERFLEYDVMKLVSQLANPDKPLIGVISSVPLAFNVPDFMRQPGTEWAIARELENQFNIRNLPRESTTEIPEDVKLLMLVHPQDLSDELRYAIDQFVMNGGNVVVLVDPAPRLLGQEVFGPSDLPALMKSWGVGYDPQKIVLDPALALTVAGADGRPSRNPTFMQFGPDGLSPADVITADLSSINLAGAGVLTAIPESGMTLEPLIKSSTSAGVIDSAALAAVADPETLMAGIEAAPERMTIAARASGTPKSAFPERAEGNPDHKASADGPVNIVVIADADLLSDPLWVEQTRFLGQDLASAFADNGNLLANALDNLLGSGALIGIRAQGTATRPFTRVQDLRREAEAQLLATEQRLEQELTETERKLGELQTGRGAQDSLILSPEQQAELDRFRGQVVELRQELREVRRRLDADVQTLGTRLKVINIAAMPLVVTVIALGLALWRTRRRQAA